MDVTANATRSGEWWAVSVPQIPGLFTQVRRLDQIEAMVRDAADTLGLKIGAVAINADVDYADRADLDKVRDGLRTLEQLQAEIAARSRTLAARLRAEGLSVRDVGTLMGISPQRVSQLTA
ncbi:XRE family transcriptional regulator [Nocardia camponoti]|uniref:Uncharacterized protein n=1 Tax=Nocardia camponoti TaxID=1616106 RepID=A0A917V9Z3_9NOCA|nr:XRE family transcriptional regulator [Nocardia camponoti]GGK53671.1 hypothetical protein GCM10011591_26860 [Nocardia camponoti]